MTEAVLREQYQKVRAEQAQGRSGETLELEFKREELKRAQELVNAIARRIMEEEDQRQAPNRVELYRQPMEPKDPVECFPYTTFTFASLAAFCLPYGVMGMWAGLSSRQRAPKTGQAAAGDSSHC